MKFRTHCLVVPAFALAAVLAAAGFLMADLAASMKPAPAPANTPTDR